ncbi:lipopolysaccharide biosynthesis protein [Caulobacter sp. ErkDOM-E]|uniref:lipopolysaccharide biosynthesis protein n=1 Tax=Caulobacter sp. ErkDOM-E TaxID=3402778 RepID=UPI003AF46532
MLNRGRNFVARIAYSLANDATLRKLTGKGGPALIIKVTTAGVTFAMFVLLARWLGPLEYGRYATLFTLATFLAFLVVGGFHTLALRQLPALEHSDRPDEAIALVRDGYIAILLMAASLACIALAAGAALSGLAGPAAWVPLAALGLATPLAIAEYQSNVLRGWGSVLLALLPRDVLWRLLVLAGIAVPVLRGHSLGAGVAFAITAAILLALVGAQFFLGLRRAPSEGFSEAHKHRPAPITRLAEARWLWAAALSGALVPQLGVVVVGGLLSPTDAGVLFAAQRTAALLSLPLVAAEIIGGPMIAHAWAKSDPKEIQRICKLINLILFVPVSLGAIAMAALSGQILSIFRPEFSPYAYVLIILSLGTLANALCGPTGFLLLMTGNERQFVLIYSSVQIVGLGLVAAFAAYSGLIGAAIASAVSIVAWNVIVALWSRANLGIDPTILVFVFPVVEKQP